MNPFSSDVHLVIESEPHSLSTLSDKHLRSLSIRGGAESGALAALEAWLLSCPVTLTRDQIQLIQGDIMNIGMKLSLR